jgi:hypothetical protein
MEGKFFRQRYIALVFTYIVCRSDFATEISRLCTVYSKRVVNERHCDVRSESRLGTYYTEVARRTWFFFYAFIYLRNRKFLYYTEQRIRQYWR